MFWNVVFGQPVPARGEVGYNFESFFSWYTPFHICNDSFAFLLLYRKKKIRQVDNVERKGEITEDEKENSIFTFR